MEDENSLESRISALEESVERLARNVLTALQSHDKKFSRIAEEFDVIYDELEKLTPEEA